VLSTMLKYYFEIQEQPPDCISWIFRYDAQRQNDQIVNQAPFQPFTVKYRCRMAIFRSFGRSFSVFLAKSIYG
ncbi:MAG TPA: hypothetical protein VHK91_15340, partial [Flavisolibacter sp.]|nr:hypothetical protein [Flavisolibacter sp.]